MQLVLYDGRPAAVAGATRVWLAPEVHALPRGHAVARFVAAMCLYARDVHEELVPGPYSDARAELYARCLLLPDRAAAAGADLSDKQLAEAWGMPLEQVRAKRCELGAAGPQ